METDRDLGVDNWKIFLKVPVEVCYTRKTADLMLNRHEKVTYLTPVLSLVCTVDQQSIKILSPNSKK